MPPKPKTKASTSAPRILYWFRTDLRLHDSPALHHALSLSPSALYCVWTWDPHYVYHARVGPNRWQYLLDCQADLSRNLTKLNPKQRLLVVREAPTTVLPKLWRQWKIDTIVFEKDTDSYAKERDEEVMKLAKKAGVEVIVVHGRTLYDPDDLIRENGGKPTMSITQVQKAAAKLGGPQKPVPTPKSLPDPGDTELSKDVKHEQPVTDEDVNERYRTGTSKQYDDIKGPKGNFGVATLEELGIEPATTPHRGGESIALAHLSELLKDENYIATFSKPSTAPTAFEPPATTLLSPHLHFGSLGVREFYWRVQEVTDHAKKNKRPTSSIPTNLPGQLLFRDMYFAAQHAIGAPFARVRDNPICRFVPWDLPLSHSGSASSDRASVWLSRWRDGKTGFPFIDALMRQLRLEGWIHHLGRHAVACFLTRGGAYISWEAGADVFHEWLLDAEPACNAGNWMWLSCTAFFSGYHRVYSPVAFGRKWDSEGKFVRKYVPELENFEGSLIYEPWKASEKEQKKWGCFVKGDGEETEDGTLKVYPTPMFDFNEQRAKCMRDMKRAYEVGIYGDDPRVGDGTWVEAFPDNVEEEGSEGSSGKENQNDDRKGKRKTNGEKAEAKGGSKRAKSGQMTLDAHLKA